MPQMRFPRRPGVARPREGFWAAWTPIARLPLALARHFAAFCPPQPKVTTDPKFLINASRRKDVKRES